MIFIVAGADIHGGGLWGPASWFNPQPPAVPQSAGTDLVFPCVLLA